VQAFRRPARYDLTFRRSGAILERCTGPEWGLRGEAGNSAPPAGQRWPGETLGGVPGPPTPLAGRPGEVAAHVLDEVARPLFQAQAPEESESLLGATSAPSEGNGSMGLF
jgi:hypothetical protein